MKNLFEKIKKGKKVCVLNIKFRCAKCGEIIESTPEIFYQREEKPFSAQSSSSTLICPKCNSIEFVVMPQYEWLYRRKCYSCNQMFETPFSWEKRCKPCERGAILQYETY